jgi:microsomal dipeptidase-like Zn-dependent dipeptidase
MSIPTDFDWEQIHYKVATIVDLHTHPSLKVSLFHRALTTHLYASSRAFDPFSVRTNFDKLRKGGLDVLLSVVYAPEKGILQACRPLQYLRYLMPRAWKKIYGQSYFNVSMQMLDEIENEISRSTDTQTGIPLGRIAHSRTELEQILSGGKDRPIAFVHCIEGGHSLDGDEDNSEVRLKNLETLFQRGVAYMTLAHFYKNAIVHPCYPWPESMQKFGCFQEERDITKGLTKFGEQVVEKMVSMGMLIDVSHCTPPARARIFEIVGNRIPLLATHVGAYAINPDPYNLKDWEIRRIADSGGVVGVIFMNYWLMPHETKRGLNFITRTVEHFVQAGGIEHTGIGSDFDGFTDPPDDLKDASELPKLTQRLLIDGYKPDQIAKLLGGNALRALLDGWEKQ